MNTTMAVDETKKRQEETPGFQLARAREKKGYSVEYIATKLHLRVKLVELLEVDDYEQMPQPVFIKGYIQAYAKLLGVAPGPLLVAFNSIYSYEQKTEKALWQSKRESHAGERFIRWFTGLVAISVIVAVSLWWQNKEIPSHLVAKNTLEENIESAQFTKNVSSAELSLSDVLPPPSLISPTTSQLVPLEDSQSG